MIAICPECNHEQIYKGHAKRPRVHCIKCKKRFYITTRKTQKEPKESKIPQSNNKLISPRKRNGGADPPSNRGSFIKIDDDMIESILLQRANSGEPLSDNFIKTCIQFYKDLRGSTDKIKDDIPMEDFMNLGKSIESSD